MDVTAEQLQRAFYRANVDRYEIITPNTYLTWESSEMDLLCVRKSGYIDEVEIKISKADFAADFRKRVQLKTKDYTWPRIYRLKHEAMQEGLLKCNRFSFLVPESLVDKIEVPEYAGLYVMKEDLFRPYVTEVKRPKLFHKNKITDHEMISLGKKMSHRYWLSKGGS